MKTYTRTTIAWHPHGHGHGHGHGHKYRYVAAYTAELQAASGDPALQTYVNWNNFDGRMYVNGRGPYPAGTAAQFSYDWFEWARMKGGSMLWTEDWMPVKIRETPHAETALKDTAGLVRPLRGGSPPSVSLLDGTALI